MTAHACWYSAPVSVADMISRKRGSAARSSSASTVAVTSCSLPMIVVRPAYWATGPADAGAGHWARPVAAAAGGSRTTGGRTGGSRTAACRAAAEAAGFNADAERAAVGGVTADAAGAAEAAGLATEAAGVPAGAAPEAGNDADTTASIEAGGISDGVAAAIAAAVAAAAVAALPAGGHANSAALRGLPIGVVALPWRTAAMSSSLGYRPASQ